MAVGNLNLDAPYAEKLAREYLERLAQAASKEVRTWKAEPYLQASDEPSGWDQSGLVRLDVAIYCFHLTWARVALRSIPESVRQRITSTKRGIVEKAASEIVGWLGEGLLIRLASIVTFWLEVWKATEIQMEVEKGVRRGSLRTMRELLRMKLDIMKLGRKKVRVRTTKQVASRN